MKSEWKSIRNWEQGFTLLELLIAIVILAIGLLAAASMQGTSLQADAVANRGTNVTTVAQQIMDDLMSVDIQIGNVWFATFTTAGVYNYDRFPPYNGPTHAPVTNYLIPGVGTFSATYRIIPNVPTANISQVIVQINVNGTAAPISFVGYRAISTS
jgi:prepilin-type N-terminal cleavage/methylation domain-containing protein